jgi:hypothetical protein
MKVLRLWELIGEVPDQIDDVNIHLSETEEGIELRIGLLEHVALELGEMKD